MIYRFKSRATADVMMLGPQGDALLRALGREPSPRGIVEAADLPAAIAALQAAVAADEALRQAREALPDGDARHPQPAEEEQATPGAMRCRCAGVLWPVVEMMKRALAADEPVVWGA
jgi:hypothetical protein